MTYVYDTTGTPIVPGTFPGLPYRRLLPGIPPEMPPAHMPAVVIIVLFTVAITAGQYELAAALGTLLSAPLFVPVKV
ncbi:hypothetical protein [Streptomyces sp. NPDC054975]